MCSCLCAQTCSSSYPIGNQVGGLPLVVHTGAGEICRQRAAVIRSVFRCFAGLVPEMVLFVMNVHLGNDKYIYDLHVLKGAFLSMEFWLRWCRLKHRND